MKGNLIANVMYTDLCNVFIKYKKY